MQVYMAGRYGRRAEIAEYADELLGHGMRVVASWLDGEFQEFDSAPSDKQRREWAESDYRELVESELLILFIDNLTVDSPPKLLLEASRGGHQTELGIAIDRQIPIIIIGPCRNIFGYMPHVQSRFGSFDEYVASLSGKAEAV